MNETMNEVKVTAKSTKAEILEYLRNLEASNVKYQEVYEANESYSSEIKRLKAHLCESTEADRNLETIVRKRNEHIDFLTRTIIDKDVAIASIKDSLEREFVSKKALLTATIIENAKVIKRLRYMAVLAYTIATIAILVAIFK